MIIKFKGNHPNELIIREVVRIEIDVDVELYFHERDFYIAIDTINPTKSNVFEDSFSILISGVYINAETFIGYNIKGIKYLFLSIF